MIEMKSENKKVAISDPAYTPGGLTFNVEVPASALPHSRSATSFGQSVSPAEKVAKAIKKSLSERFQGSVTVEGISKFDGDTSASAEFRVKMSGPKGELLKQGGGDSTGLFLRYLTTLFKHSEEERHQVKMTDAHRGAYKNVVENIDPTFMDAEYRRDTGIPNSVEKLEAILQKDIKAALGQSAGRAA